jgi:hypothetical protein
MSYILHPKFLNGFEVEWITTYGPQVPGDFDPDLIRHGHKDFEKRDEAEAFARSLLGQQIIGDDVRMTTYDLTEYEAGTGVYFKTYGDTEYFSQ